MKKTITKLTSILFVVLLVLGTMSGALAASGADNIAVETGANAFNYSLDIDPINTTYASLQFDVTINNDQYSDLQITSIEFSSSFGTAAQVPTDKDVDGFKIKYQTGFVSTENQFSNADVKQLCSVTFQYTGSTPVSVMFNNLTLVRLNELSDGSVEIIEQPIQDWSRTLNVSRTESTPNNGGGTPAGGGSGTGTPNEDDQSVLGETTMNFDDVTTDDWFYDAVQYAVAANIIRGVTPTTFEPETPMTRGMFVTILYRLEGEPAVTGANPFEDVAAGLYYITPVIWASANHIVDGYDSDTFAPDDVLTREQLVTMLYRYAAYKGYDMTAGMNAELSAMTDAGTISAYALTPFKWAYASDIIHGTTPTTLSPGVTATRAQGAKMLMDFMESFVKRV